MSDVTQATIARFADRSDQRSQVVAVALELIKAQVSACDNYGALEFNMDKLPKYVAQIEEALNG